jgi:hypothetical protein
MDFDQKLLGMHTSNEMGKGRELTTLAVNLEDVDALAHVLLPCAIREVLGEEAHKARHVRDIPTPKVGAIVHVHRAVRQTAMEIYLEAEVATHTDGEHKARLPLPDRIEANHLTTVTPGADAPHAGTVGSLVSARHPVALPVLARAPIQGHTGPLLASRREVVVGEA